MGAVKGAAVCWCWPVFAPSLRRAASGWQAMGSTPPRLPTTPRHRDPWRPVEHLTEPIVYTVDARSDNVWIYFDFPAAPWCRSSIPRRRLGLAFKRYVMKTNGGRSNPDGQGAVLKLLTGGISPAVSEVPGRR